MKRTLLLLLFFNLFFGAYGQGGRLWTKIESDKTPVSEKLVKRSVPSKFQVFTLDMAELKSRLAGAPDRKDNKIKDGVLLQFPNETGVLENYRVFESAVMDPALAAKYPDIKSYVGIGADDAAATICFTTTLFGLHSMTLSGNHNNVFIEPYTNDLNKYMVYDRGSILTPPAFECFMDEKSDDQHRDANSTQSSTQIFRTYRLALSCTTEYADFHVNAAGVSSGTLAQKKAAVLAAMVVTMARVNGVFERDLAIHMNLISNNDVLINITSDNFSNTNGGSLLGQNQSFVDANVGNSNYDIGHVFSTGGGGIARRASVCNSAEKAKGVTGSGAPVGDAFDIDYVAHEMGHQFGGNHTFNADFTGSGSCETNKNLPTAVEPGSGTTIMAYAGICNNVNNVQNNSDAHFSFMSIQEIDSYVASGGNCSANVAMTNSPPVIKPIPNYTIPKSTPFILKGNATDAQGNTLTYCWEENDRWNENTAAKSAPPVAANAGGPNFRSRPPSASPERYMPLLSSVLANNITPNFEVVPSVARTMNFVLTVRDNNLLDGGQTQREDITVTTANVGPFVVTAPNTTVSFVAGSNQTITWDVAGTTSNGINCNFVDIYMSSNSGSTFPTLLASGVPNDGSEIVTIPNLIGSSNRIMVRATDNIFYDVSNANFAISSPPSSFSIAIAGIAGKQNQTACAGSTIVYPLTYAALGGFNGNTTFSVTGNPPGSTVTFSPNPVNAGGGVTMTVSNTSGMPDGFYTMTVTATSGATTKTVNLYLTASEIFFSVVSPVSPVNLSTNQPTNVVLNWTEDSFAADSYDVQLATDVNFVNIVANQTVTSNSFQTSLNTNTTYFWRVRPRFSACAGSYSTVSQFTTGTLGVEEPAVFNFSLYPNPNNGSFNIQSDRLVSENIQIMVYDMRGRVIFDQKYPGRANFDERIQLPNAQAGVYLLSVSDGAQKAIRRIVVK
ncbi:hypothetical protein HYN48_02450 [Flavobacterium magnum]|uniref:Fibronectin type-III domain-containing protein n=1 Tax=Flavobacterium magnum TaxID=2162713 RepID=A0A2S0RAI7_9FLAO|nr:zinc-dependent metalloprotease family protein [Flavobacterium magnum]AWA29037.1 hypothetical protein HYN48_02450 [Flavobacterium magnum]